MKNVIPWLFGLFLMMSIYPTIQGSELEKDPFSKLRKHIYTLLKDPEVRGEFDEKVRISFFITSEDEIIVLKTDTREKILDRFIKEKLNYRITNTKGIETNKIYNVIVDFNIRAEEN